MKILIPVLLFLIWEGIQPSLIVHGGAGTIRPEQFQGKLNGMVQAIRAGYKILLESDNPLNAVEEAVRVMEDDPSFNAGEKQYLI